jgi:hypothetical protein
MIARALGRLILVPLGLLMGLLTAAAVLVSLGLERTTHTLARRPFTEDSIELLFRIGESILGLAGVATLVPALIVVVVGEVARIRSALFYIAGGGVAFAILPLLAASGPRGPGPVDGALWTVLATAGFAGGLVYWLIADRKA